MNNPFQQIPGIMPSNPAADQMGQLYGMVQAIQNPLAAAAQMTGNSEQLTQVMQYIKDHGGDPKNAFYAYAKENGADPSRVNDVLSQAQSMMKQMNRG